MPHKYTVSQILNLNSFFTNGQRRQQLGVVQVAPLRGRLNHMVRQIEPHVQRAIKDNTTL